MSSLTKISIGLSLTILKEFMSWLFPYLLPFLKLIKLESLRTTWDIPFDLFGRKENMTQKKTIIQTTYFLWNIWEEISNN
jgi:hypothetical protein